MSFVLRVLLAAFVVALVVVLHVWQRRRRRAEFVPRLARLPHEVVGAATGPLTVFYFTSRFCGACHETPALVRDAAPEVRAVALPVEEQGALARRLGIDETPTLLLVDEEGRIRYARVGNPSAEELWTYVREAWDSLEAEGALVRTV